MIPSKSNSEIPYSISTPYMGTICAKRTSTIPDSSWALLFAYHATTPQLSSMKYEATAMEYQLTWDKIIVMQLVLVSICSEYFPSSERILRTVKSQLVRTCYIYTVKWHVYYWQLERWNSQPVYWLVFLISLSASWSVLPISFW